MADLPVSDPLSGPGAPPFLNQPTPPASGTITLYSTAINGPMGERTIGPLTTSLTEVGTDADIPLTFTSASSQTVTAPMNSTKMIIRPPASNQGTSVVALSLGSSGEIPISPNDWTVIGLPDTNGGHTYTITAAGALSEAVEIAFV